jgi:hypothetical protein
MDNISNVYKGIFAAIFYGLILSAINYFMGDNKDYDRTILIAIALGHFHYIGLEFNSIFQRIRELEYQLTELQKRIQK